MNRKVLNSQQRKYTSVNLLLDGQQFHIWGNGMFQYELSIIETKI